MTSSTGDRQQTSGTSQSRRTRPPLTHQSQPWASSISSGNQSRPGRRGTASPQAASSGFDASAKPPSTSNIPRRDQPSLSRNQPRTSSIPEKSRKRAAGIVSTTSMSRTHHRTQTPLSIDRCLSTSPAEVRVAKTAEVTRAQAVTIYPELDRYRGVQFAPPPLHDHHATTHPDMLFRLATQNLPPNSTSTFSGSGSMASGVSASPSTRFSESPAQGGPYSRDTTPTSMTSQSPGYMSSMRSPPGQKSRQGSGSRGRSSSFGSDVSNEKSGLGGASKSPHPLSAIRESANSSSSSTAGTVRDMAEQKKKIRKKKSSTPPTPPPRKSSQKFKKSEHEGSSSRPSTSKSSQEAVPPLPQTTGEPIRPTTAPATSSKSPVAVATSPQPPSRPSRDGTPDLKSQLEFPMPVIQSNLTSTALSDRRASMRSATAPPLGVERQRTYQSPELPTSVAFSRQRQEQLPMARKPASATTPSPAMTTTPVFAAPPRTNSRQATTTTAPESNRGARAPSRTPSPGVSTFRNRFPIFTRRAKTPNASDDKTEKPTRKGPAAGTGHEGYGRLGASRRRSSSANNMARGGITSSQESLDDPFLRDRMSPVVIAGGEVVDNKNTRGSSDRYESGNESTTSNGFLRRPSIESRNGSQASLSSREGRHTLWPSAIPRNHHRQASPLRNRTRRPSDSSDSEAPVMRSNLAFRRSIHRLQSPDNSDAQMHLPKPIVVRNPPAGAAPSITSHDTTIMSDDSFQEFRPEVRRGRKGSSSSSNAPMPKKLTKRARSPKKWNLFGRSQSQPEAKKAPKTPSTVAVTVEAAAALAVTHPKPVAFYTMMDSSEAEDGEPMDIEDVLREAHVLPPLPTNGNEVRPSTAKSNPSEPLMQGPQIPLPPTPSPAKHTPPTQANYEMSPRQVQTKIQIRTTDLGSRAPTTIQSAGAQLQQPQQHQQQQPSRPSRLPQVGRIPRVNTSVRPEQGSPMSFSRPFNRASMHVPTPVQDGPSPPESAMPDLIPDGSTFTGSSSQDHNGSHYRYSRDLGRGEFLAFPPRNNSQSTSCTTSSSSGLLSFAAATAVVPDANAPLVEDEIWDEYNDLLGEESKVPQSATSSHGMPFHLEEAAAKASPVVNGAGLEVEYTASNTMTAGQPLESPTIVVHQQLGNIDEAVVTTERPPVPSSVYSSDVRAQVLEAVEGSVGPATPFSVSEFVSGYGDHAGKGERNSKGSTSSKKVPGSKRSSASSKRSSGLQKTRVSDGSVYSQISEDNSPTSQVNLRVGSMSVSKWLTFGHVLFSPVRDALVPVAKPPNGHSVLVLDGLGNDDWSFYAAETFPAATFFNLSPRAPLPVDQQSGEAAFPVCPPNHHQIQYTSYGSKLPFQSEIFTTVVFRFPAAAPEARYRNIINEARRVLKPGGYLEMSILDFDLNNMGNRTRRALRRLKEQIHMQSPDIYLGSASDLIVRLLGAKGYSDIKSCRVGVPVASAIPQSSSSDGSAGNGGASTGGQVKPKKDERSLAEMIFDESPVADENITNMVAKVGRWWHTRCYTNAALQTQTSEGDRAIDKPTRTMWTDRAILTECQGWRTNLKLMVCYARAPDIRRMASI